jgi:hypothetical protein
MNVNAYNAGVNARAKTNAVASATADKAVATATKIGSLIKFAALSTANAVQGFVVAKPIEPTLVPEPTITITERELHNLVSLEATRLAEAMTLVPKAPVRKPRATKTK